MQQNNVPAMKKMVCVSQATHASWAASSIPQLTSSWPGCCLLYLTWASLHTHAHKPVQGPVFKPPRDDYNETFVYGVKNSPVRAQYDTGSVYFWADGSTTSAIGGHWASIAFKVLPATYTTEQTALFFARFGASLYDAR